MDGQLHFNSFLGWSVLFHSLILSLIIINPSFLKEENIAYIPAIRVDVVALPDKQPSRRNIVTQQKKTPPKTEVQKPQPPPQLKKCKLQQSLRESKK